MSSRRVQFPNREEWLAARRLIGVGSSDAPVILGVSRYKTAFQLYREKIGEAEESKSETEQMQWGKILEGPIAERYRLETGRAVFDPREEMISPDGYAIEVSNEFAFMVAQVDRYTKIDNLGLVPLEIKNAHFFAGKPWLDNQEPPIEFIVQLQHQLAVTGAPWGSMAALIGGCRFVWTDIPRDDVFIKGMIEAEYEFWIRCRDRQPPAPDGSDKTRAAIDAMFRRESSGVVVPLEATLLDAHAQRQRAVQDIKAATAIKNEAENKIKLAIGENAGGRFQNGTLYTWKTQTRAEFVSKATSFRVLRSTEPKSAELPAGARTNRPLQLEEGMDTE